MLNKALGAGTVRQRCHATWGISKGLSPCKLVWPHEPDGRLVSAHQLRRYRGITKAEDISQMKRSQAGDKHQSFVDAVDMPANKQSCGRAGIHLCPMHVSYTVIYCYDT